MIRCLSIFLLSIFLCFCAYKDVNTNNPWSRSKLLFSDSGTADWKDKWMLDGLFANVVNTEQGMELIAGPEFGNDSSHAVLWTKESFKGNLCIEYDYTRTDTTTRAVNILYFHATGSGDAGYPLDISLWNNKRTVPKMSIYFNNMRTYHISYAAFSATEYSGDNDYVRLRRYDPGNDGLSGTDIPQDYFKTGLFKTNETYHIQVCKYENQMTMQVNNEANPAQKLSCQWDISGLPSYEEGRVGFRHMYTRKARYKDIRIWKIK